MIVVYAPLFSVIRCRIKVRTRHPSGSRLQEFAHNKRIISRPWQSSSPQKTVGTTPCPRFRITDPLALPFGWPTPMWLTAWAFIESQHRRIVYVFKGWNSGRIKSSGSKPSLRVQAQSRSSKRDTQIRQHFMERSFAHGTRFGLQRARWRGL